MVHQFVFRRPQRRVPGMTAPAGTVHQTLRMFDAKADRKRLALHRDTTLEQHRKGITRAVSQSQHHRVGAQLVGGSSRAIQHLQ